MRGDREFSLEGARRDGHYLGGETERGSCCPSRLKDRVRGRSTGRVSRIRTRIGRVSRLEIVPDLVPSLRERYTLSCPVYLLGAGESLRQEVRARARRASRVYEGCGDRSSHIIVGVMGMVV